LGFDEKKEKVFKIELTGPEFCSLRQTHRGASYNASNISPPNILRQTLRDASYKALTILSPNFFRVTELHRAFSISIFRG
jgi:hypothetical protein